MRNIHPTRYQPVELPSTAILICSVWDGRRAGDYCLFMINAGPLQWRLERIKTGTYLEPPDHPVVACIRRSWFTDTNGSHYFGNICCLKEQHERKTASSHVRDFLLNTHAHWLQCQNSDFWLTFVNQNRLCLILLPGSHRMDPEHRLFKDLFDGYNFNARPVVNKSDAVVVRFDMAFSQLITLVRANSNRHQYGTRTLISGSVLTLDSTAVSPEI